MVAKILDGKYIAEQLQNKLSADIKLHTEKGRRAPELAVILVGDDDASRIYVKNKRTACQNIGMVSKNYDLPADTTQQKLLDLLDELNNDPSVDGILVQLPLPAQIDETAIVEYISPIKDVDGFHPFNLGRLAQGRPAMRPCTPAGIMLLLKHTKELLPGKKATVIGTSNIVGRPMVLELLAAGTTVTACNSSTKNLEDHVKDADILVVATGNAELIKGSWIKPGAIVLDVGINRTKSGKLIGDVEFDKAREVASWITPVPGGVGPMTIASLLQNTFDSYANME